MTSYPLQNYLKTNRKRLALSQDDVAFLMGAQSGTKISRYEQFTTAPNLETALAYEIIFQKPARELFSSLYQQIEKEVIARAEALTLKTEARKANPQTPRKRETLANIITQQSNKFLN